MQPTTQFGGLALSTSAAKLLTKDEARRIACDDSGNRKDKRPNTRSGRLATSNRDLNGAHVPFDFFFMPFFFGVGVTLLLDV
jgi:hypothetical protein